MVADSFRLIGITLPDFVEDEARLIQFMLESGMDRVHVRKPGMSAEDMSRLLEQIPESFHGRLSIHDNHELIERFPNVWLHLNARNPILPDNAHRNFSRSCHSLRELSTEPPATYSFLSPIFNSISKTGYESAFSQKELEAASESAIINERVVALGGVVPERLPLLRRLGFGGAAMLGYLWADLKPETIKNHIDVAIHYSQKR